MLPLIDFILNITGLLLWLNWLSLHFDPLAKTSATSLVGTLRKADPSGPKRWLSLTGVAAVLIARAFAYWEIGPALGTPNLALGAIRLSFRSDYFGRVLLFSLLSFFCALAVFYLSLLLLSAVNRCVPDTDPLQKLVRLYFKWLDPLPTVIKMLLPLAAGGLFWLSLHPLLVQLSLVPSTRTTTQLLAQALVIGLGTYLSWKYLILTVLVLHLLNSYVYFGNHPLWNFVNATAQNLLRPLQWLPARIGRVDLAPVVAIALLLAILNFPALFDLFSHPGKFREIFYHHLPF